MLLDFGNGGAAVTGVDIVEQFFDKAGGENATFCVAVLIKGRDMRVEGPVMDETDGCCWRNGCFWRKQG